jgi:hypothetical protein
VKAGNGGWGECLLEGISDGNGEFIASGCRQMPAPDQCIKILRSTHDLPWWGVYLQIAIPTKPGLPILFYVGSATAATIGHSGLSSRFATHISGLQRGKP